MLGNEFGSYLKSLREIKGITQEQLGEAVGRKKMTISLLENGKNDPPQGDFLEKIITELYLDSDEDVKIRDLAALPRNCIPSDIIEYFKGNENIRAAIRRAKSQGLTDADWKKLFGGDIS